MERWRRAKDLKALQHQARASGEANELIEALRAEEFFGSNPFERLTTAGPFADIIAKGVVEFSREISQSPEYMWAPGNHDIVRYTVKHPDGTQSHVLAYKQKDGPYQLMIGGADLRPTFNLFFVSKGADIVYAAMYKNGALEGGSEIERSRAVVDMKKIIPFSASNATS